MKKYKKAIILTASGGNFSQEVAIIEQLIKSKKITIDENDTLLIATGTSSINLIAINACFRNENPCSWENYYKTIFLQTLSNEEIFLKIHPAHWSTLPMRQRINQFMKITGFAKFSDLPFDSIVLSTSLSKDKTKWLKSNSPKLKNTDISDIVMASSALPVVFPPQNLNSIFDYEINKSHEGLYNEASSKTLLNKAKKQLKKIVAENGRFEEIFIISPKRDYNAFEVNKATFPQMQNHEITSLNSFFEHISLNGFLQMLSGLEIANTKNKIAENIYVSLPEIGNEFDALDFSNLIFKYKAVEKWISTNPERLSIELQTFNEEVVFIPSIIED